ncbi:MAG: riboflavin kinase [Candidatus Doudnabacteria bacterium]
MKFLGIVKKHVGRGKILGFPTANIVPPAELEDGLYVGWTKIEAGEKIPSLIFIGTNPTFNESFRRAEVYLLDFKQDIYDKEIEVEPLKRIRDVEKFDTPEALVLQMKEDERVARDFFKGYNLSN